MDRREFSAPRAEGRSSTRRHLRPALAVMLALSLVLLGGSVLLVPGTSLQPDGQSALAAENDPLAQAAQPAQPKPGCTYFPQTQHNLCAGFRAYWETFGGLAVYGYPLTEEYRDPETGLTMQWFERARFEWHPGVWPERYDVLLGLLGRELTAGRSQEAPFQPVPASARPDCIYFPETRHHLCAGFRAYWEQFGGLAVFGYPISEEFREVNPDDGREYTVQYFERQRFEWHPGAWPERYDVLLGRLGAQLLAERLAPPQPTPTPTPTPSPTPSPTPTPAPEVTISLSPESDVNLVGTEHTVTARVERDGEPVEDVRVRFRVTGVGEPSPASGNDRTDENGEATFSFTNSEVGTNTITAFADLDDDGTRDDGEPQATASKRWEAEAEITLSPESDVNLGGTEHTVIAEVTVDGTPQDGLPVTFAVTSEGSPEPEGDTVVTNADGEASFTYTNTVAGTDTITACLDLDEDGCEDGEPSATASKRWVVNPTLLLDPATASNPVNEQHTVTASLTDGAGPVEGVRIVFRVQRQSGSGSPSPSSGAAFTDENGQASFTFTSTVQPATDQIIAFADFDRDNVRDAPGEPQNTATKSWTP